MTSDFAVVCWKWTTPGYRSTFGPETVNVLRQMVARHYPEPHRFLCVTDDPVGLDPGIEVIPDRKDFVGLPSPHGGNNPSCYRRLRLFSPDIVETFGPRFVSLDLDCVIAGDLRPLWNRPEDFVAWGDTNPRPGSHYNGSMMLLSAGARRQVWDRFNPLTSPREAMRAGCWGSDQGWLSYCLGPHEKKWTKADGVYSFRNDLQTQRRQPLPKNAKVVFFHGKWDPWHEFVQLHYPWAAEHYRRDPVRVMEACL